MLPRIAGAPACSSSALLPAPVRTPGDIESGLRAGAALVAGVLTGAGTRAELEQAGATAILGSIAELPALLSRAG